MPRGGAASSRIFIHIRAGRQPFPAAEVSDGEAGGPMDAVIAVPAPYSHDHPLICLFLSLDQSFRSPSLVHPTPFALVWLSSWCCVYYRSSSAAHTVRLDRQHHAELCGRRGGATQAASTSRVCRLFVLLLCSSLEVVCLPQEFIFR